MKRAIKGWMREAIQKHAGSQSPLMSALQVGLDWVGRWPAGGPTCLRWAGLIHATQGRHSRAVASYKAALDGGLIGHPSLHYDLGQSLLETGNARQAEAEFRTVLAMVPREAWPVYGLIQSLLEQGRDTELIPELLAAAKRLPAEHVRNLPFPDYLTTAVLENEAYCTALRKLVSSHPDAVKAAILLAKVETLRGNGSAAAALFRSAGTIRFGSRQNASAPVATPTFFIIGQAKAGTSALFQYLSGHPSIVPPVVKEPWYWSHHYDHGTTWYQSLFPRLPVDSGLITGEGSVAYLTSPDAPARVHEKLPEVKLIVLLREPVARAYSEYWMHVRRGEQGASFEEVIAGELAKWPVCPLDDNAAQDGRFPGSYLRDSAALPHLKRWRAHFPPEQLLILRNEQMAQDLPAVMHRVCRFIGVPPFVPQDRRRHGEGHYPPMAGDLKEKLRDWFTPHQRVLEQFLASLPEARP
jgi:hypothetical protein